MSRANNTAVLIGRVGKKPEPRHTQSGKMVVEFSLAVNRPTKDRESGETITDWWPVQVWGKPAEFVERYVDKGDLLSVSGPVQIDTWEQDGFKRSKAYCLADSVQSIESRAAREERRAQG